MVTTSGNILYFYIFLGVAVAILIHLYFYGRRRRAMLQKFARDNGLKYSAKDINDQLADDLTENLQFEDYGRARGFSRIRDIGSDGEVSIFRCIQLLDTEKYGDLKETHNNSVCVSFNVPEALDLFVLYQGERFFNALSRRQKIKDQKTLQLVREVIGSFPPKHTLSITLQKGRGLLFLYPLVTGSEKYSDLEYLFALGHRLKSAFDYIK